MAGSILLISVSGADSADITAAVLEHLAQCAARVLDIGQAVIHGELNLGVLLQTPPGTAAAVLVASLNATLPLALQRHQVTVRVTALSAQRYARWLGEQALPRHIVTLLAKRITTAHLGRVGAIVAAHGLQIHSAARLSGRTSFEDDDVRDHPAIDSAAAEIAAAEIAAAEIAAADSAEESRSIVELELRGVLVDQQALRRNLMAIARTDAVDVAVQADDVYRRNRRLVAFDMDSTLIQGEVIDELAAAYGVGAEVAAITAAAMRGELDFAQSFRRRVALLAGASVALLDGVVAQLRLSDGAERLVRTLKRHGYRTAILSGGFQEVGERLRARLGIDVVHANRLEVRDGSFTGRVVGEVIDGQRKAALLRELVAREGLTLAQSIAVGDGANDVPMLSIAGLGIAYRAKPVVADSADHAISHLGLDAILYLIGFTERDLLD